MSLPHFIGLVWLPTKGCFALWVWRGDVLLWSCFQVLLAKVVRSVMFLIFFLQKSCRVQNLSSRTCRRVQRLLLQQVVNFFLINLLYFYTGFFRSQVKALLLQHGKQQIQGHVAQWVCSKLEQETGWELSLRQIVKVLLLAALSAPAKPERKLSWSFMQLKSLLSTLFPRWKAAGIKWNF